MQGPATFLLAIMGCGEGETQCEQVQVAPARYESQAACQAATEGQLIQHADLAYPVVVAECRRAGVQTAAVRGTNVRLPEPRGRNARVQTASARR